MRQQKASKGFTLIELMVVVAILGILASVAIPTFSQYLMRARISEATQMLKSLFDHASTYYTQQSADPGIDGAHRVDCAVASTDNGVTPGGTKQAGDYSSAEWLSLRFTYPYSYFRIEVINGSHAQCSIPANTSDIYTFRVHGDLDDDSTWSTFEFAVGSSSENELYHSRGFVQLETE